MKPNLLNYAILMAGVFTAGVSHAQNYQFIDLGSGSANGINNLGQVVGYNSQGAALWNGTSVTLLAGGSGDYANVISNSGVIAGVTSAAGSGEPTAVEWTGSTRTLLQSYFIGGTATGVNDAGEVVGGGSGYASLWVGGKLTNLTTAEYVNSASATGINNAGLISGYEKENNGGMQAIYWANASGTDTLLGTLGGSYSQATAVNNAGEIVGQASNAAGTLYATTWKGTTPTQLQSLGGQFSFATAVNDAGTVVGYSTNASGQQFATEWNGTSIVNLNNDLTPAERQAGWVLTEANGINQNGWIVGEAVNTKVGGSEAFELKVVSPVPEADSWAMLLAGLTLIGSLAVFKPKLFKNGTARALAHQTASLA